MYGVEDDELGPTERIGKKMRRVRYRWMNELPIPDGKDTMNVNWLEIIVEPVSGKKLDRNSFATDIPVDRSNVAELAECARARWKVENNTFKALMDGYHPEHNFEHGKATLASLLAMLNIHWRAKRHLPHMSNWREVYDGSIGYRRADHVTPKSIQSAIREYMEFLSSGYFEFGAVSGVSD